MVEDKIEPLEQPRRHAKARRDAMRMHSYLTRRCLLGGLACLSLIPTVGRVSSAEASSLQFNPRVLALDWGYAEMLLALGIVPLGVPEIDQYAQWVVEPPLPAKVVELGLRTEPNMELMQQLRADLIIIPPWLSAERELLGHIAPVTMLDLYSGGRQSLDGAAGQMRDLAALIGRSEAAEAYIQTAEGTIKGSATAHILDPGKPIYLLSFLTDRQVMIHTSKSLFHAVLVSMGLTNAWQDDIVSAPVVTAGIDRLAQEEEATIVVIEPMPPGIRENIHINRIWQALSAVHSGHVIILPPVWAVGSLPSAVRLSKLLAGIPPEERLPADALHG